MCVCVCVVGPCVVGVKSCTNRRCLCKPGYGDSNCCRCQKGYSKSINGTCEGIFLKLIAYLAMVIENSIFFLIIGSFKLLKLFGWNMEM